MASVTLRYRGPLADLTGKTGENLDGIKTVRDVMRHIRVTHGAAAEKQAKSMLIAINGESMLLRRGFATRLKDGEVVQFLPMCGGG